MSGTVGGAGRASRCSFTNSSNDARLSPAEMQKRSEVFSIFCPSQSGSCELYMDAALKAAENAGRVGPRLLAAGNFLLRVCGLGAGSPVFTQ